MPNSIPVLIIPVLNRHDLLESLLDSINYEIDNILIVDNSGKYVLPNKYNNLNIKVLNMPCNFGVSASWNLGIKCYPHSKYFTFISIDSELLENTLENMSIHSDSDSMVISNYGFSFFSIGSEIIKKVGIFDENYYPAYFEDFDFEDRVRKMGYKNNIKYPDVNIKLYDTTITVKSNPKFLKGKQITDISNEKYYKEKFVGFNWTCYNWELQRRLDNDWDLL